MSDKQIQKAGDSSLQIQAGTVNNYVTIIGTPETQPTEIYCGRQASISDSTVYEDETRAIGDTIFRGNQFSEKSPSKYALQEGTVPTLVFCIEANEEITPPNTATLLNLIAEDASEYTVIIEDAYLNQLKREITELSNKIDLNSEQEEKLAYLMAERKSRDLEIQIRTYALRVFLNSRELWYYSLSTETPTLSKLINYLNGFIKQGWFGSLQQYYDNQNYSIVECYNDFIEFKMPISKEDISAVLQKSGMKDYYGLAEIDSLPPIRDYFSLIDFNFQVKSDAVVWLCYRVAYEVTVLKKDYEPSDESFKRMINILSFFCGPA